MSSDIDADLVARLELLAARRQVERLEGERDRLRAEAHEVRHQLTEVTQSKARIEASVRFRLGSLLAELATHPARTVAKWLGPSRQVRDGQRLAREESLSSAGFESRRKQLQENLEPEASDPQASDVCIQSLPSPPAAPPDLGRLCVAAVLDAFSMESLAPECDLVGLTPDNWGERIRNHRPHLLLVESAWLGLEGEWKGQVERAPAIMRSLVASCRAAGIPTVFWNKEDPLHFEAFIETARLFDHVLTTDASSIPRYRRILGPASVGLLPFGFQPRVHHPVGMEKRIAGSVFAGAWYGNMPDRCADFEAVADALALAGPLVIHDRHDGKGASHQRFPSKYGASLRPGLSYGETASLYRSYRIGVNLNTVKQSPSMFARRVLEMVGCNTSVYGNFSLAVQTLFGDLSVSSDDPASLLARAWQELREPDAERFRRRRLAALRKVLSEHTWAHRLQAIADKATGGAIGLSMGQVKVLARAGTQRQADAIVAAFRRQSLASTHLVLVADADVDVPDWAQRLCEAQWADSDWVAVFHPDDFYDVHYLEDLALARAFGLGDAVGKGCWMAASSEGAVQLNGEGLEYRFVDRLALRRSLLRVGAYPVKALAGMLDEEDAHVQGAELVSLDALNYIMQGASLDVSEVDDTAPLIDVGMRIADIQRMAEGLQAEPDASLAGDDALDGRLISALFNSGVMAPGTSARASVSGAEICSLLQADAEDALFSAPIPRPVIERAGRLAVVARHAGSNALDLYLDAMTGTGEVASRYRLFDGVDVDVPLHGTEVVCYRLAATVRGRFVHHIKGLWLAGSHASPLLLPGTGRLLLVCNGYPEAGKLYRNGFLHRRVAAYRANGIPVDVVVVAHGEPPRAYEYDGVLVQVCTPGALAETVARSEHSAIAVHFLDEATWAALERAPTGRRIVVWLHGAEIQSPRRRSFNYPDGDALRAAIESMQGRDAFWRALFLNEREGLHFVFVSRAFAEEVWSDLGLRCADDRWCVIHNPIDTSIFQGPPKAPGQRLAILSVRPHDSRIYANDLVRQAIELMADDEIFTSLSFQLVGDGALWNENFAGLERYANVTLRREFLRQEEVARLHRQHGIFLVPTRGDTQGVSRDEAMSSGLVPVTCRAGAVGEFVDAGSGIMCAPEDPQALATAVLALAKDAALFSRLSAGAVARARAQSGIAVVLPQELDVLGLSRENVDPSWRPGSRQSLNH